MFSSRFTAYNVLWNKSEHTKGNLLILSLSGWNLPSGKQQNSCAYLHHRQLIQVNLVLCLRPHIFSCWSAFQLKKRKHQNIRNGLSTRLTRKVSETKTQSTDRDPSVLARLFAPASFGENEVSSAALLLVTFQTSLNSANFNTSCIEKFIYIGMKKHAQYSHLAIDAKNICDSRLLAYIFSNAWPYRNQFLLNCHSTIWNSLKTFAIIRWFRILLVLLTLVWIILLLWTAHITVMPSAARSMSFETLVRMPRLCKWMLSSRSRVTGGTCQRWEANTRL